MHFILKINISFALQDFLKTFPFADESVFATLALNDYNLTKFPCQHRAQNSSVKFGTRFKQWIDKIAECVSGKVNRAICIVRVKTLPQLINSSYGKQLAVNKFKW